MSALQLTIKMFTVLEAVEPPNNLMVEVAAVPRSYRVVEDSSLNRLEVAAVIAAVQRPVVGSIDSKQHNFDSRHMQHRGHHQVDWQNIERTELAERRNL